MTLQQRIKDVMTSNLMLDVAAADIGDDSPLFGPGGIGLDSVDALQLVVALDKIADQSKAKDILQTVNTIAAAIEAKG